MMTREVVIVSAARTPIGAFQGSSPPSRRRSSAAWRSRRRSSARGSSGKDLHEVLMGCVLPAGQGQAPARQASRGAGCPTTSAA
jgi:acetyl-CoA C-acetyltransferase